MPERVEQKHSQTFSANQIPVVAESVNVSRTLTQYLNGPDGFHGIYTHGHETNIPVSADLVEIAKELDPKYYAVESHHWVRGTVIVAGYPVKVNGLTATSPRVYPNAHLFGSVDKAREMFGDEVDGVLRHYHNGIKMAGDVFLTRFRINHECSNDCYYPGNTCPRRSPIFSWHYHPKKTADLVVIPPDGEELIVTRPDALERVGQQFPVKIPVTSPFVITQ